MKERDSLDIIHEKASELEKALLEEIMVDFLGRRESEDGQSALRNAFHAIGTEAGLLGLVDLERVCHAAVEFMATYAPSEERAVRLLKVKDWIAHALKAYGEQKPPETPAKEVILLLQEFLY